MKSLGQRCLVVAFSLLLLGSTSVRCCDVIADLPAPGAKNSADVFLVEPYLQLGDVSPGRVAEDLRLLWQTEDVAAAWAVEYRPSSARAWRAAEAPTVRRVAVPSIAPHRVYCAVLKGLASGSAFTYRVRRGDQVVFSAEGRACKAADEPYRFVVFGDCGAGTAEQKAVAYQVHLARPDFVMITGDIVYSRGRISEYREKFWPIYNAGEASPQTGAPLRSTLFVAAPGNHDIANRNLEKYPDGLAYFLYWDQPRNGLLSREGGPLVPALEGPVATKRAFVAAAGSAYPRMANFSFDYGNAHWTILDSNSYVDWTDPELRAWVERDLAAAREATWRFVVFHHPGFNSAKSHFGAQLMRLMAEVFEAARVNVVFSGHVHNYQRTFPLRFTPEKGPDGKPVRQEERIPGRWTLDKTFDGRTHSRPQGVIYLTTGAGGNRLYNPEQQDDPASWQPFTDKFVSKVHSMTIADVNGSTLIVRQVSAGGQELDCFMVTK